MIGQLTAGLALAVSVVMLAPQAQAQTFKAVPLDGGGWTSGFAQADNGRLYAYGDVFGAWRSDNGGTNWSYLNWNIPGGAIVGYGMAVQKDNADVVYYYSYNAIFKSTNGGTTWTNILSPLGDNNPRFRGASPIMIRSNNPNEIWFAGPRKDLTGWLWKSSDGGTTWAKAGGSTFDSNRARTLHNVAAYANQIWVGSDYGLYVSTDGGNNFTQVSTHPEVGMIQRYTSGANAGVGLITRGSVNGDGGGVSRISATDYSNTSTFTTTASVGQSIYFGYPTGLQIFSDNTACAWNTSGDRQGYSTDGGLNFAVRNTTLNTSVVPIWTTAAIMSAKNHPDYGTDQVIEMGGDPNKWLITGGGAAMYSLDKGLSWQYFPNGSGIAAVKTYLAGVSRYDANRIYIPASDIGSAIVTDGGASGLATRSSCKFFTNLHGSFRIMEGPDLNNLAIAGVNQGQNKSILMKSSDGGVNWAEFNLSSSGLPASTDGITKAVMSISNANDFLVVLSEVGSPAQRVYRTTNGGSSFTGVSGLPDNSPTGGRYGPQNAFIERDATQANVRYFVARGQNFYKSTDSGANWSATTHPFGLGVWVWGLAADPIRSDNLWAAGDFGGVKVSRDGGSTWTSTAQYLDARYVSSCDGKIAVLGKASGDTDARLYYSSDDGATFTAQTNSTNNFHGVQGITVDRNGKIWVSWNSCTVVTPAGAAPAAPAFVTQPVNTTVTAGSNTTFTVGASGSPAPSYQWQRAVSGSSTFSNLLAGGTYSGVTGNSLTVSGTTVAMSGDQFRAVATNGQGSATSSAATLVVTASPVPVISSALTRSGNVGSSLSYTITASNSPTSFGASGLPAGLSVNTSTGVISGTPTATGTVNTTISATNAGGTGSATLVFTISAALPSAPVINSALTKSGTVGTAISNYTITATNSPTSYGASGLPAGLSFNSSTGVISGTPTAAGTVNTTISATNAGGTGSATLVFTIAADPAAPVQLTGTIIGTTGSYNNSGNTRDKAFDSNTGTFFDAPGANGNWVGLDLGTNYQINQVRYYPRQDLGYRMNGGIFQGSSAADFSSGVVTLHTITSVPGNAYTTVAITNGSSFRYVRYLSPNDGYGNVAEVEFYRSGSGGTPAAPVVNSALTRSATVGTAISTYTITATNSPTSYGASGLPTGLSVNTSTGAITGTPTASGTVNTTISATNAGGTGSANLVFTISAAPPAAPVINSALTRSATVGTAISVYTITATNSPTSYGASGLPTGLSVNTSTGAITGTPAASGTVNTTISATNAGGTGSATLVFTITAAPPSAPVINSTLTANGTVGIALTYTITASNSPTSYGASGLPAGLSVNTATGVISGTPTASGTTNITISATNSGGTGSATLVCTIGEASGSSGLTRQYWTGIGGTTVADLTGNTAYPNSPTGSDVVSSLRVSNWGNPSVTQNWADNYGQRLRGYLTAPATGSYTFWIASDDSSELWLSTNDQASSRVRIATVVGWTSVDSWTSQTNQRSAAITLTVGQRYFIEVLHKEGGGGDHLSVGWRRPADGAGSAPAQIVPGSVLSPLGSTGTNITLVNPGFENGMTGWSTWANSVANEAADYQEDGTSNSGSFHLAHWMPDNAYQVYTYQIVTGLTNGSYTVRAWIRNSGGQTTTNVSAKNYGGSLLFTVLPVSPSAYQEVVVSGIQVSNGQLEIGFWSDASAGGQWIEADDVTLVRVSP